MFKEVRVMIPSDADTRRAVIDKLGTLTDQMHDQANTMKVWDHGNHEAMRDAADFIAEVRKQVRRSFV